MFLQARPVYLELPTDLVFNKIPRGQLDTPLTRTIETTDLHVEEFVLDGIQKLAEKAGPDVVILIDACTIRHDVVEEVWDLIQRTGFPVYCAPMGKTAVAEDYERFGGVRYLCLMVPHRDLALMSPTDLRWFHFSPRSQGKGRKCKTSSLHWWA